MTQNVSYVVCMPLAWLHPQIHPLFEEPLPRDLCENTELTPSPPCLKTFREHHITDRTKPHSSASVPICPLSTASPPISALTPCGPGTARASCDARVHAALRAFAHAVPSCRISLRRHLLQAAFSGSWASLAIHSRYSYDTL